MATPLTPAAPNMLRLLDILRSHLITTGLPDPAVVTCHPTGGTADISIQPDAPHRRDPAGTIAALLLWTHRVHGITGTWRLIDYPDGAHVHVGLAGRLSNGTTLHIYTSFAHAPVAELVHLEPGETDSVSPDELAWLRAELLARTAPTAASPTAA